MEQPSSSQFGVLLGLPLIAIVLVVVVVEFVTGGDKPDSAPASASTHQVDAPPPEPVQPVPPKPRPPAAPPPASAPTSPLAAPPPQPQVDARAVGDRFQDPKVRQHAQLMVTESARLAMQKRNLEQLRRLRDATRQGGMEQVIPPSDLQAIDVGLDCLVQAGGFRARAGDFLEDNPSSVLAEALRSICL